MKQVLARETGQMLEKFLEGKTVLVCDPSSNFRTSIKQFLLNLKVKNVRNVANTTDARRILLTTKVGLFIVEWIGETENGLQFCREMKKRKEFRLTPFLLMTSENLKQDVVLASEGGVDRYLLKPFSFEDFTEKLHSMMKDEMDPNPVRQLLKRADAALFADDHKEAEELYRKAQRTDSDSARAVSGLAKICWARKQEAKAIILLQTALSINPEFIGAHKTLLEIYEQTQDYDGMLKESIILNELSPENPAYTLRLATLYLQKKNLELSEKYFKKAVSISPSLGSAYKGLGDVAMLKKEYPKAERSYQKCLDLTQNDISVLNSLGMAFVRMGKFQEGIQRYLMALKIDSKNEKITFNLGHAWEKLGNVEEAKTKYRHALKLNPGFGKAKRGLARVTTSKDTKTAS